MGREERGQRKKEGTKGGDSFRCREGLGEENFSIQGFPPSFVQLQDRIKYGRRGGEESGRKRTGGNRGKEGSEEQSFLPTACRVF